MKKVRVSKEFHFEMAHALWNYDGPCKNIHGHSYKLQVTISGTPITDIDNKKQGMLMDFSDLKKIVNETIIKRFDHALIVNKKAPRVLLHNIEEMFEKYYVVDYQPTCENLVLDMAERIKNNLPEGIILFCLRLSETATSYAEWYANDNQ